MNNFDLCIIISDFESGLCRKNKTMKGVENLVNMGGVGNSNSNIVAMKILMRQGKPDQAESKKNSKKLCICSPN